MKVKVILIGVAMAAATIAPQALSQGAPEPQVVEHKSIPIGVAFPDLKAGEGRVLHARKIALAPGAQTELIDRTGRPAITYVTLGEVMEHREGLAPIRHGLHAATLDRAGVRHFWRNASAAPAELLVVEIAPPAS